MNGLLDRLGLGCGPEWTDLATGERAFAWRHLAEGTATIGEVVTALSAAGVRAPRTGHLADWDDIWHCRSTVLDYNAVLCRDLRAGYPMLFDFTQCETAANDAGDTLFQPGALFRGGRRTRLALRRWNGGGMVAHDRARPVFQPYTEAEHEGSAVALTTVHRTRLAALTGTADTYSQLVWRHRTQVEQLLTCLVEAAADDRALSAVFDRIVHPDGTVTRAPAQRAGSGFVFGDQRYPDAAALVAASLVPFAVANSDEPLGTVLRDVPSAPLASVDVVALTHVVLGTHRPAGTPAGAGPEVHVHWGALAMAGAPPVKRGYFASRARRARRLYEAAVTGLPWARTVLFVMAPVAPFFLWLPESAAEERGAVAGLLERLRGTGDPDRARAVVGEWLDGGGMTPMLRDRFGWSDRTAPGGDGELLAPEGIADVPVATACLLAGLLAEAAGQRLALTSGVSG